MTGACLLDATREALLILMTYEGHEETSKAIAQAVGLATIRPCDKGALFLLGEGWVAEEALGIALYCALSYDNDFIEGVLLSVNHAGDSDSTGSMTGNLLGALLGVADVPSEWLRYLELQEPIRRVAEDLHNLCEWDLEDDAVWARYPGW
jgi:ADP-ribosylglycohydrolase